MPKLSKEKTDELLFGFIRDYAISNFEIENEITPQTVNQIKDFDNSDILILNPIPFITPKQILQELPPLIDHLAKNRDSLLSVGVTTAHPKVLRWLDLHLSNLYPTSFQFGRAVLNSKKDETGNTVNPTAIVMKVNFSEETIIDDESTIKFIKGIRPKLLKLKLSLLNELRTYLSDPSYDANQFSTHVFSSIRKQDVLLHSDIKTLLNIDERYFKTFYKYKKQQAFPYSSGGLSDLLFFISYCVVEKETNLTNDIFQILSEIKLDAFRWSPSFPRMKFSDVDFKYEVLLKPPHRAIVLKAFTRYKAGSLEVRKLTHRFQTSFFKDFTKNALVNTYVPNSMLGLINNASRQNPLPKSPSTTFDPKVAVRSYKFSDRTRTVETDNGYNFYDLPPAAYWSLRLIFDEHKKGNRFISHADLVNLLNQKLASLGSKRRYEEIRGIFKASKAKILITHPNKNSYSLRDFHSR
jgi:hypothetical protein